MVTYIKENITENSSIITVGKLKIINTKIKLEDNQSFEISALYRCHEFPESEFIFLL